MGKLLLVFIDLDEAYVTALERKFVEVLGEHADISIITDMCYFSEYFSIPRDIDILVVNEQLYDNSLANHNISLTYILTENQPQDNPDSKLNFIYKYTSVQEIFNQISSNAIIKDVIGKALETQGGLFLMHSPLGGVGTTTLSLGAAIILKKMGYRVLYISMENMQSFVTYINNQSTLPDKFEENIIKANSNTYENIKNNIIKEEIDYLQPFSKPLSMLGIREDNYIELIKSIRASGDYDYIVIDTDSYFSKELLYVMGEADRIFLITNQSKKACLLLEKFSKSIATVSAEKFLIICNKYCEDSPNELINNGNKFYISDYICFEQELAGGNLNSILNSQEVMRLSNYLS